MRKVLNILLVAVVLSPALAGLTFSAPVQSCECEPAACHCPAHDHSMAHGPMCAFANGGRCGVKSADLPALSPSTQSMFLVTEAASLPLLVPEPFGALQATAWETSVEPRPPTPPPRFQA